MEEETYLLVGYPSAIHNKSLYPELMSEDYYITFDDIRFCIVNGRRGIRVLTLGELEEYQGWHSLGYSMRSITKGISYSFFYWSPEEQRYVLDETVTQEELENAWCPKDYFAYNGLQFSNAYYEERRLCPPRPAVSKCGLTVIVGLLQLV